MSTRVLTDEAFRIVLGSINDNYYSVSQSNNGFFFFFFESYLNILKMELVGEWSILQLSFVIILWETWKNVKNRQVDRKLSWSKAEMTEEASIATGLHSINIIQY